MSVAPEALGGAAPEAPVGGGIDVYHRRLPPVGELATLVIVFVVASGIYIAAHLPTTPPLAPAYALMGVAAALLLVDVALAARLRDFAWSRFFLVAKWTLVAYIVEAGMLEYVFVNDHTRGAVLAILTATLAIFAVDIPLLLGFMVARYQPVE